MAAGVGIDLLEIDRLERALERHPRLADRVFTEAEQDYAAARARPGRHLAARFAAKEAVVKALGSPAASACARSRSSPASRRRCGSRGARPKRRAGRSVEISLTHSRDFAAAVAIAETP